MFRGWAVAQDPPKPGRLSLSAKDKTFMKNAAEGGLMEVTMGNLAEQNAQSQDVKPFGKRMVADHSKVNDELKAIAQQKGLQLPSKEPGQKWTSDKIYIDVMGVPHFLSGIHLLTPGFSQRGSSQKPRSVLARCKHSWE
jgi:hypothetical protein